MLYMTIAMFLRLTSDAIGSVCMRILNRKLRDEIMLATVHMCFFG